MCFAQVPAPPMGTLVGSAEGSVLIIPKVRKGLCVSSGLSSVINLAAHTPPGLISLHSEVTQHPQTQSTVQ